MMSLLKLNSQTLTYFLKIKILKREYLWNGERYRKNAQNDYHRIGYLEYRCKIYS